MKGLIEGFRKFREQAFPEREDLFHSLAHQQSPGTLFRRQRNTQAHCRRPQCRFQMGV